MIYKAYQGQEDGLSCRGFDDGRFADPSGVKVDVSTLFGCFRCNIEVEDFNNITDQIW